jgi:hypothetical protein
MTLKSALWCNPNAIPLQAACIIVMMCAEQADFKKCIYFAISHRQT